jgi:predicted Rossmann fold nucleotide-binding protein DprA/Smf involved in DNA uptake
VKITIGELNIEFTEAETDHAVEVVRKLLNADKKPAKAPAKRVAKAAPKKAASTLIGTRGQVVLDAMGGSIVQRGTIADATGLDKEIVSIVLNSLKKKGQVARISPGLWQRTDVA